MHLDLLLRMGSLRQNIDERHANNIKRRVVILKLCINAESNSAVRTFHNCKTDLGLCLA